MTVSKLVEGYPMRPKVIPFIREFEFGAPNAECVRTGTIDVGHQPIKGEWIAFWGWDSYTKLTRIRVGNLDQLLGPIPAYVLGPVESMSDTIKAYSESLRLPLSYVAQIDMNTADIGMTIRVEVFGAIESAVLFGKTLR